MEEKSFISIAQIYLDRFPVSPMQLNHSVDEQLEMCIVIPSYNEPDIVKSLKSISNCDFSDNIQVDVIVVINHPEGADPAIIDQNIKTFNEVKSFNENTNKLPVFFHTIDATNLPKKHAGVGWARKIGMDEALRRFQQINKDGIICCFDADATLDSNYIKEVLNAFQTKGYNGAAIFFEHPLNGTEFKREIYDGILKYETHLRYYKNALKYCGVPYAYHTVGSSMAVRASAYAKQGGMNRRKAGEDFYFINKIIGLGNFGEVNTTRIIPSPRVSDRVPFGTGRAIQEKMLGIRDLDVTYSFKIFIALKEWLELVIENAVYEYERFPELIKLFLNKDQWCLTLDMLKSNSASTATFKDRFYKTFDAFWILKYVHFIKEHHVSDSSLIVNANELLNEFGVTSKNTLHKVLEEYKEIDKQ